MKNKKSLYIISSLFVFSLVVTLIDAFVHPGYFTKIPIKIIFFLILPLLFFVVNKSEFKEFKALFSFKKKGFFVSLLLGSGVYAVILGGYFLTRNIFDYGNVTSSLTSGMGITKENFLYVALYISIMNSFLEEFFFRGFGFITLGKYTGKAFAYIFNSCIFAFYHVGMLIPMFEPILLVLLLAGLIAGGCIFSFLNDKTKNIYPSWFVHMFANFAINTVGFILFGVL